MEQHHKSHLFHPYPQQNLQEGPIHKDFVSFGMGHICGLENMECCLKFVCDGFTIWSFFLLLLCRMVWISLIEPMSFNGKGLDEHVKEFLGW